MFVILVEKKEDAGTEKSIVKVLYTKNENIVRSWALQYAKQVIEHLDSTTENVSLYGKSNACGVDVSYKTTNRGYLYNTTKTKTERLLELSWYEYLNHNIDVQMEDEPLSVGLNEEINNRVLKQLDKESLYQLITRVQQRLKLQEKWNHVEYTNLMSEMVRDFRKELYSNVARRLKRFGKRTSSIQ